MSRLVFAIDGGMIKYAVREAAKSRLGCKPGDDGTVELAQKANAEQTIYDITAITMKNRLSAMSRLFGTPNVILLCMDIGMSWRTGLQRIQIPGTDQAASIVYKGSRQSDNVDLNNARYVLNRHHENACNKIAAITGLKILAEQGTEADDYMIVAGKELTKQGNTVIILSDDHDIAQACNAIGDNYCACFQWKRGAQNLVIDHPTLALADCPDIFNMTKLPLSIANAFKNAQILAPQYMLLEMIVNGDGGDDVSPIMLKQQANRNGKVVNHKTVRKTFDRIYEFVAAENAGLTDNQCKWLRYEDLYDEHKMLTILDVMHTALFGCSLFDLSADWQNFYKAKWAENRRFVVCNEYELGLPRYSSILQQITDKMNEAIGTVPILDIPTTEILNKLPNKF